MKTVLAILLATALTGCAGGAGWRQEPSVIVQYKTEYITIPEDHLVIPDDIPMVDLKTATQKTIAKWIADKEERSIEMEKKLRKIKELQDERIKSK